MSEKEDQIPAARHEPAADKILPYANPENQPMSIGLQAAISAIVTVLCIAIAVVAGGFLAIPASVVGGDGGMFAMLTIGLLLTIFIGMRKARRLTVDLDSRGWVIGIYIGIGIGALLWGYCSIFLFRINHLYG
jgi:hypothetical protein